MNNLRLTPVAWTQSYTYDSASLMTNITSSAGAFTYAYDAARKLQVNKLELPNTSFITNTFDSVVRLTGTYLKNSGKSILNSHAYVYNASNQRANQTRTDGSYADYTYDNIGQLKTAKGKESGGTTNRLQEQLGYAYDAAGNLNYRTNNTLIQTFNVNSLNELTTATNTGKFTVAGTTSSVATNVTVNGSNAILYADSTFAQTNNTLVNGTNTYTAIAKDSYGRSDTNTVSVNLPATNNFAYDLNGNLLTNGTEVLIYDDENQLVTNFVAGAWKSEFVYDGKLRRRIQRDYGWNGSSWTQTNEIRFVYDGNVIIQHRDANNLPTLTLTRGRDLSGSLQGAGGIGGLLAMTENAAVNPEHSYYHADGNGNVTCLINTNQLVAAKALFDPFGNFLSLSGPKASVNCYWFSSKPIHWASGKYDFLYRWYAPQLQRWLSSDPIGERGGLNLYAFVRNNPGNLLDYLGLKCSEAIGNAGNSRIIFAQSPPKGGWKVSRFDFTQKSEDDSYDGIAMMSGVKVTWSAEVIVLCRCDNGCFEKKKGTRVFDAKVSYEFFAYELGGMPVDIPTPTKLVELIGEGIAAVVDWNLEKPISMIQSDFNEIASRVRGTKPTKPTDGKWKGGKSPCN